MKNTQLIKATYATYFAVIVYASFIILADAGNLMPMPIIIKRWIALTILLFVNTVIWYLSSTTKNKRNLTIMTIALALTQLGLAGFTTYWERGMGSANTLLYALPIVTIAMTGMRRLITASATIAAGTYALAVVVYFNAYFNEGYRIQLWSQMVMTIGVMYALAWVLRSMLTSGK